MDNGRMPGRVVFGIAEAHQSKVRMVDEEWGRERAQSQFATVAAVYGDRNACDLLFDTGDTATSVPVGTRCGLIGGECYGELDLPAVGDRVLVEFLGGKETMPYISAQIIPYLANEFQTAQVPVKSANKTYTKKLLEAGAELVYRRILKSGTTVEVMANGSVVVETPNKSLIMLDETAGTFKVQDKSGNVLESTATSILINENLEVLK